MKKNLLFAAALVVAMSANAQEYGNINVDALGVTGTAASMAGGTVVASSANVTMKVAYTDDVKSSSLYGENDAAQGITLGGTPVELVTGITGNTNPSASITAAPTSGFVLQFDVQKDGYLYVLGKLSSNKPYYVWEGTAGNGEKLMAYSLVMRPAAKINDSEVLSYTLPADDMGYFNASADDAGVYTNGTSLNWPEVIFTKNPDSGVKKNGLGVISFQVFAEAGTYLVHATGSKITSCGYVFSETQLGEVAFTAEPYSGGETGITSVDADKADVNAPVYNLAGQRVSKNAKGILIQNGKKFISNK